MSIVGVLSGNSRCQNCDAEYGNNTIRVGLDSLASTPPNVLREGMIYDRGGVDAYVCDVCLFGALRTAFGHLLIGGES